MVSKLINRRVDIVDRESIYYKHWGYVVAFDGDVYHISGGSIATSFDPDTTPIFNRDQFKVKRKGVL